MADVGKLQEVLNAAMKQAGEESSLLLGQGLEIRDCDAVNTNKQSFFTGMEDAIFAVGVESREDYPGQLYMIFSLRDAILLSSMLLGIPPARISEKRKLAIMEPDDADAFGEIMNQVIGSFNSVLQPKFPSKLHLKLLAPKKFIPGVDELSDEEPIPTGEYIMFRSQLQMDGLEMDQLNILIPIVLANLLMPDPVVEETAEADKTEAPEEEAAPASELEESAAESGAAVIILDDDELDRQHVKSFLASTGLKLVDGSLQEDIKGIFSQNEAKVAVIGVSDPDDQDLALCIKINALCQDAPVPIIMCAHKWTRLKVLKALKYGARDIIMKPFSAEELVTKVTRLIKAA
ncbi:response regulator [Geobacter sp. DSM 9736]|uniref:response regulator n=1 Tax=Geobacter sp. DSM 9736 TaxID=1277350 RepID=UPI000B509709|nr:response regulator [Geobacter sp. DSM 9736]SNB47067.1 Response regulator receiver domain-containing protein [Geobacter sp. DSM 9736]